MLCCFFIHFFHDIAKMYFIANLSYITVARFLYKTAPCDILFRTRSSSIAYLVAANIFVGHSEQIQHVHPMRLGISSREASTFLWLKVSEVRIAKYPAPIVMNMDHLQRLPWFFSIGFRSDYSYRGRSSRIETNECSMIFIIACILLFTLSFPLSSSQWSAV